MPDQFMGPGAESYFGGESEEERNIRLLLQWSGMFGPGDMPEPDAAGLGAPPPGISQRIPTQMRTGMFRKVEPVDNPDEFSEIAPYLDPRMPRDIRQSGITSLRRRRRANDPDALSPSFRYDPAGNRVPLKPGERMPREAQTLFSLLARDPNYINNPDRRDQIEESYPGLFDAAKDAARENSRGGGRSIAQSWRRYRDRQIGGDANFMIPPLTAGDEETAEDYKEFFSPAETDDQRVRQNTNYDPSLRQVLSPEFQVEERTVEIPGQLDMWGNPRTRVERRRDGVPRDDIRAKVQNRREMLRSMGAVQARQDIREAVERGRRRRVQAIHGGTRDLGRRFGPRSPLGRSPDRRPPRRVQDLPGRRKAVAMNEAHNKRRIAEVRALHPRASDADIADLRKEVVRKSNRKAHLRQRKQRNVASDAFQAGEDGQPLDIDGLTPVQENAARRGHKKGKAKRALKYRKINRERARQFLAPLTGDPVKDRDILKAEAEKAKARASTAAMPAGPGGP